MNKSLLKTVVFEEVSQSTFLNYIEWLCGNDLFTFAEYNIVYYYNGKNEAIYGKKDINLKKYYKAVNKP